MHALIPLRAGRHLYSTIAVWLAVFLSPTAYLLLLIVWARFQLPAPRPELVVALFCLIPLAALWVCGKIMTRKTGNLGALILMIAAMALQIAFLLAIIVSAITVAISLP
jgi:hypothetical protein